MRKRLEAIADSETVSGAAASLISARVRKTHERTDWTFDGRDKLGELVSGGQPVIMALWHGRLGAAAPAWDPDWGTLCVVTSSARPGRMVGHVMKRFGHDTLPMRDRKSNTAMSLQVARMARGGVSLGFAVDGPEGPPMVVKPVPIDWARLTGCPIWMWTMSVERYRTLGSWDRMALPKPGGRGCMLYRPWNVEVPKRMDADLRETLRAKLESDLTALTLQADREMGHAGIIT